jgi:hypothetical protein
MGLPGTPAAPESGPGLNGVSDTLQQAASRLPVVQVSPALDAHTGSPVTTVAVSPTGVQDTGGLNALPALGPGGGPKGNSDPLWVLDANNAQVVTTGVPEHVFAGASADFRAQVSGDTVTSYLWTLDANNASDFTGTSSLTGYQLTFTWNSNIVASHTDTVHIRAVTVHGQSDQDLTFDVIANNSAAWVNGQNQPTTYSNWPSVVVPDALKPGAHTVDGQYYSLGLDTGEVDIAHALPSYNHGIAPEMLTYSSTAADRQPVFIAHYPLDTGFDDCVHRLDDLLRHIALEPGGHRGNPPPGQRGHAGDGPLHL